MEFASALERRESKTTNRKKGKPMRMPGKPCRIQHNQMEKSQAEMVDKRNSLYKQLSCETHAEIVVCNKNSTQSSTEGGKRKGWKMEFYASLERNETKPPIKMEIGESMGGLKTSK